MQRNSIKRKLGWLEMGLYLGGIVLLAVFFHIRAGSDQLREEGVKAFQQSLEMNIDLTDQASGNNVQTSVQAPDQELWADKRIREYEESLKVDAGPPMAVLTIEKLGVQVPVYNGADDFNLNRGVARIKGTAAIDTTGNLGIAGHRDGFFRALKDINIDDSINLETTRGTVSYAVSSIDIVEPSDVSVLAPTEKNTITLVTCYPFYYVGHAPKRFIVTASAGHLFDH